MRLILVPAPGAAATGALPASPVSPPSYCTSSAAVSMAASPCRALTLPVKIAVLSMSSTSRRLAVMSIGPSPPPNMGVAGFLAPSAAARFRAHPASPAPGAPSTSWTKAISRLLLRMRISLERTVPDGISTSTGSLELMMLSLVRMVALDSLRLEAALGDDVDAAGQLQLIGLGIELALRRREVGLRLLGVGHVAGDVVEAHELGVDEILDGRLGPHDVLAAVLVEALVARVIHRQVVGDDARQLQLGEAARPARGVHDHHEVERHDARGPQGEREAQRAHEARVAARARKIARPVGRGRAAEGVATRPFLARGEIGRRCHAVDHAAG